MQVRGRRTGSDATVLEESPETMSSDAATTMPEMGAESETAKTAATVSLPESEIAAVAHQLWLDKGCPVGSDQEDWFRAEGLLRIALVAQCEDPLRTPSTPCPDTRTEPEILAEFRWEGHWEVWESEWGSARWIWDSATPRVEVSNRAG